MLTTIEINYGKIKLWIVIVLIQIGSFVMGAYTAHTYWVPATQPSSDLNYTTNQANGQNQATTDTTSTPTTVATNNQTPNTSPTSNCKIKGNISAKTKIYHVPGGSFYDRTTPEMCFNTEAEALAAGFSKSSR